MHADAALRVDRLPPAPHMRLAHPDPFCATSAERVEWARRRYFEEGIAPAGLVSDTVFESWARCQRLHGNPMNDVAFEPVTRSRTHLALQKNNLLREAWQSELPRLEAMLGSTNCAAMLTDAKGVLIGAACAGRAHERLMPIATRLGVDLSEAAVGTTAPGVVARTGRPVCVFGAEHYFDGVKAMSCAASPIRDIHGQVAGVLDISCEYMAFSFDAAAVVNWFACAIENTLLVAQSRAHLVVRLQLAPSMLDSAVVGLVGVDSAGRVAWCNGVASRLLGLPDGAKAGEAEAVESTLGVGGAELAALPGDGAAALRLGSGLQIWARADMQAPDGHRQLVNLGGALDHAGNDLPDPSLPDSEEATALALPEDGATPSLHDRERTLVEITVQECGGNISAAARKLRVSRNLIYRQLGRGVDTTGPR